MVLTPRIALTIFSFLCSFAVVAPASAQDGASPNAIYNVDLSADGKSYAILRQYQGQRVIVVYDADDASKPPMAVGLGDLPTRDFAWGDNDHVMVQVSGEKSGLRTVEGNLSLQIARWMVIDKNTGEMKTVFSNEIGNDYGYFINSAGDLISTLPDTPGHALFARKSVSIRPSSPSRLQDGEDEVKYSLQDLNLKRTRARVVEDGKEDTIDWVVNQAGDAIARIDSPSDNHIIVFARPSGKGGFKQILNIDYDESPHSKVVFYGAAEKPGAIQALVTENSGAEKLVEMDLETGAFGDVIFEPDSGGIQAVIYDHRRAKAIAAVSSGGILHFNSADAAEASKLEKAVPGSKMLVLSKSASGDRMLVQAFKADGQNEYYFYDVAGRRLDLIAAE